MTPARGRTMQGLGLRVVTALVLGAVVLCLFILGPLWLVAAVFAVVAGVAMYEVTTLTAPPSGPTVSGLAALLAACLPLAALFGGGALAGALGAAVLILTLAVVLSGGSPAETWPQALGLGWGAAYAGGLVACIVMLAGLAPHGVLALFLIFCVAMGDIGAYFAGHRFGKRKLAPAISPGKTLEGLAGGLAASTLTGAVFAAVALADTHPLAGAGLGLALGLVGAGGDLVESALKRAVGAKDSGKILPGHGGLLDRIDGIMAAAPVLLLLRELFWA